MIRVLFVCTDNAVRSAMAEACLRAVSCGRFEAWSAGIRPAGLHPLTRIVLTEAGLGVRELHSKSLDLLAAQRWEYVISVSEEAASHPALSALTGARRIHWDIPDPTLAPGFSARLRAFRQTRDAIRRRVEGFAASIGSPAPEEMLV